jgi:hypothetical protein
MENKVQGPGELTGSPQKQPLYAPEKRASKAINK